MNAEQYKKDQLRLRDVASATEDVAFKVGNPNDLEPIIPRSVLFGNILATHRATGTTSTVISHQTWKSPVKVATTTNITTTGTQDIDGITVAVGDRVLVKNQSQGQFNGIWIVATGLWARAEDANTAAEVTNFSVLVLEGSTQQGTTWTCTTQNITLNTTPLSIVEFGAGGATSLESLTDTAITAPSAEQVLIYKNGKWTNSDTIWSVAADIAQAIVDFLGGDDLLAKIQGTIDSWWATIDQAVSNFNTYVSEWATFVANLGYERAPNDIYTDVNNYLSGANFKDTDLDPTMFTARDMEGAPIAGGGGRLTQGTAYPWKWSNFWKNAWYELDAWLGDPDNDFSEIWKALKIFGKAAWEQLEKVYRWGYVRDTDDDTYPAISDTEAWSTDEWWKNAWFELDKWLSNNTFGIWSSVKSIWNTFERIYRLGYVRNADDTYPAVSSTESWMWANVWDNAWYELDKWLENNSFGIWKPLKSFGTTAWNFLLKIYNLGYVRDGSSYITDTSDAKYMGWDITRWFGNAWYELDTWLTSNDSFGIWGLLKRLGRAAWIHLEDIYRLGFARNADDTYPAITTSNSGAWTWGNFVTNTWHEITSRITTWFSGAADEWWDTVTTISSSLLTTITSSITGFVETGNAIWQWLDKTLGAPVRGALKGFVAYGFADKNPDAVGATWSITTFFDNLISDATTWTSAVESRITTWWSGISSTVAAIGNPLWDTLRGMGDYIWNSLRWLTLQGYDKTELTVTGFKNPPEPPTETNTTAYYQVRDIRDGDAFNGWDEYDISQDWSITKFVAALLEAAPTAIADAIDPWWKETTTTANSIWTALAGLNPSAITTLKDWILNGVSNVAETIYNGFTGGMQLFGYKFAPRDRYRDKSGFLSAPDNVNLLAVNQDTDDTNNVLNRSSIVDSDGNPKAQGTDDTWDTTAGTSYPWSMDNFLENLFHTGTYATYNFMDWLGQEMFGISLSDTLSLKEWKAAIKKVSTTIIKGIADVGDIIWGKLKDFFDLGYPRDTDGDIIGSKVSSNWSAGNFLVNIFYGASTHIINSATDARNLFESFASIISNGGSVILDALTGLLNDVYSQATNFVGDVADGLWELLGIKDVEDNDGTVTTDNSAKRNSFKRLATDIIATANNIDLTTHDLIRVDRIFFESNDGIQADSDHSHISGWNGGSGGKDSRSLRFYIPRNGVFQFQARNNLLSSSNDSLMEIATFARELVSINVDTGFGKKLSARTMVVATSDTRIASPAVGQFWLADDDNNANASSSNRHLWVNTGTSGNKRLGDIGSGGGGAPTNLNAYNLSSLGDVNTAGQAAGEALVRNSANNGWVVEAISGGGTTKAAVLGFLGWPTINNTVQDRLESLSGSLTVDATKVRFVKEIHTNDRMRLDTGLSDVSESTSNNGWIWRDGSGNIKVITGGVLKSLTNIGTGDGTDPPTGEDGLAPTAASNLVSFYKFENLDDEQDNNDLTPVANATTTYSNSGRYGKGISALTNSNYHLDGGIDQTISGLDGTGSFSVAFWYRRSEETGQNNGHVLINSGGIYYGVYTQWARSVMLHNTNSSPDINTLSNVSGFDAGTWYHITFVKTQSGNSWSGKMYVDGVLKTTTPDKNTNFPASVKLRFGVASNASSILDSLRIYNKALTQAEITSLAGGSTTPETRPTVSVRARSPSVVTEGANIVFDITVNPAPASASEAIQVFFGVTDSTGNVASRGIGNFNVLVGTTGAATHTVNTDDDSTVESSSTITCAIQANAAYLVDSLFGSASGIVHDNDVVVANTAPTFTNVPTGNIPAVQDVSVSRGFNVTDNSAVVSVTSDTGSNPTLANAQTGRYVWRHTFTTPGTYTVTFTATDDGKPIGDPLSTTASITVVVAAAADTTPPVISGLPVSQTTVADGTTYTQLVYVKDDRALHATNALEILAGGKGTLTRQSGSDSSTYGDAYEWNYTPVAADVAGSPHTVTFRGRDAAGNTQDRSTTVVVTAAPDTTPPTFGLFPTIPPNVLGGTVRFSFTVTDTESGVQSVIVQAETLPGVPSNPTPNTLGNPPYIGTSTWGFEADASAVGVFSVKFRATDAAGNYTDSASIPITIESVNTAPVISDIADQQGNEGVRKNIPITITDTGALASVVVTQFPPEPVPLVMSAVAGTVSGDIHNYTLQYTPGNVLSHSVYIIKVVVTDSGGLTDEKEFFYTVKNVRTPQGTRDDASKANWIPVEVIPYTWKPNFDGNFGDASGCLGLRVPNTDVDIDNNFWLCWKSGGVWYTVEANHRLDTISSNTRTGSNYAGLVYTPKLAQDMWKRDLASDTTEDFQNLLLSDYPDGILFSKRREEGDRDKDKDKGRLIMKFTENSRSRLAVLNEDDYFTENSPPNPTPIHFLRAVVIPIFSMSNPGYEDLDRAIGVDDGYMGYNERDEDFWVKANRQWFRFNVA